ncbi:MAG: hypothetical protein WKI04_05905 [Ferruginibacter sp.]
MIQAGKEIFVTVLLGVLALVLTAQKKQANCWLTTADRSKLLQKHPKAFVFKQAQNHHTTIIVDEKQQYQSIDGFG